jgi:Zn-finger nucleic acid-binding protein
MPDYKAGKIYTIRYRNDDSLIYVGSTIQPLYKRWYEHKKSCLNPSGKEYNRIIYQRIREEGNFDDWYIELYEDFPCENREHLNKREGEVIRQIGTLNMCIAGRTKQEYRQENKEKIKENDKQYRQENQYKIKERKSQKITCVCGSIHRKGDSSTHQKTKKHTNFLKSGSETL